MKNLSIIFCILLSFFYCTSVYANFENLDELIKRKDRFNDHLSDLHYFEDDDNSYIWQTETVSYIDKLYGTEVWKLAGAPLTKDYLYDINQPEFSADGKRFCFLSTRTTKAFNRVEYPIWMMVRTDGTYLRPIPQAESIANFRDQIKHWDMSQPDVYWGFGRPYLGKSGVEGDKLYKCTVSDTSVSINEVLDLKNGDLNIFLKSLSQDGQKAYAMKWDESWLYPLTLGSSPSVDDADGHSPNRPSIDHSWAPDWDVQVGYFPGYHDQYMTGAVKGQFGVWFNWIIGTKGRISDGQWWRQRITGNDADGGPRHIPDTVYPYNWEDVEIIETKYNANQTSPWCKANSEGYDVECSTYPSHPAFDNWGKYMAFSGEVEGKPGGSHVRNIQTFSTLPNFWNLYYGHADWHAWSDQFVFTWKSDGSDKTTDRLYLTNYKTTNGHSPFVNPQRLVNAPTEGNYECIPRPTQSPDGTKVLYHSTFLNGSDGSSEKYPDIFWATAYYPYPPEIISSTVTVGKVIIRFDWRTDQNSSRGYTQRGWPNESTDNPPPPRETKLFRLWRSSDKSSWVPVKTINANIFSKYDFSNGTWNSVKYWEITDEPEDGTWYYAVTSLEWSGLESQTLSNIFSITVSGGTGTGTQNAAYPSEPGGDSNFYSSFDSSNNLTRYYNIYAEDGSTPSISQTNRIASISVNADREYIDWLGNSNGLTRYVVTAVDYQGNESGAITPTVLTDTPSAGMYKLTWDSLGEAVSADRSPNPEVEPPTGVSIVPQIQ